jgi:hypothetical protein
VAINDGNVLCRLKTEIDDALGVGLEGPWQAAHFRNFITSLGAGDFSSVASHIGLGRAYVRGDLLEGTLSEVLRSFRGADTTELKSYYETQVDRMWQKYPDLTR